MSQSIFLYIYGLVLKGKIRSVCRDENDPTIVLTTILSFDENT